MHAMFSKWAPPMERSKMVTSVYAGARALFAITCLLLIVDYLLSKQVSRDI